MLEDKMEISFIIPKFQRLFVQFPVGVLNIASELKKKQHKVHIIDLRVDDIKDYLCQITKTEIFFVSTSTYDYIQCYNLEKDLDITKKTIKKIQKYSNKKIFLIGPHSTVLPDSTLEKINVNGVIRGEYENNISFFIKCFDKYKNCKNFPPKNLKTDPFDLNNIDVDYSLLSINKYSGEIIKDNKLAVRKCALILGNRGCSFKCPFCYNFFGQLKIRKPDKLIKEIEKLYHQYSFNNFFFLDYTFTANKKWVEELCQLIIQKGLKINWICQTRFDCVSPYLLNKMKLAGCSAIWYGIENPFLRIKKEKYNEKDIEHTIGITKESGILPILYIMIQLPNEKKYEVINLNKWLNKVESYFLFCSFVPRPETKLFNELCFVKKDSLDWDVVEMIFKVSKRISGYKNYEELTKKLKRNKWFLLNNFVE